MEEDDGDAYSVVSYYGHGCLLLLAFSLMKAVRGDWMVLLLILLQYIHPRGIGSFQFVQQFLADLSVRRLRETARGRRAERAEAARRADSIFFCHDVSNYRNS